ncbi:putative protein kinase RLK-Pelle-CrRLK1L-1 family [Helianthus annuus]|nr:putative protein kinase RLK-Pelle-CrRLK1L-1 family [Helianthus annuus]
MLTFSVPFFSMLLLLLLLFASTTTTAQPYNATDRFFLACGSSSTTSDPRWNSDQNSKFVPSNIITTSFPSTPFQPDPSVSRTLPYTSALIFNASSFTYTFPVSQGPKFLRLHFYPATYSNLRPERSFFSVSSNGFSLLTNFSAFLATSYLKRKSVDKVFIIKEFIISVTDAQVLNVTFTPSPNSYAFINGIEIVSMPETLYSSSGGLNYVGVDTGPVINSNMALDNIYRLNMGGGQISGTEDTGMYRSWEQDINYIYGAIGKTPNYDPKEQIMYTNKTPSYTAPEQVYRTQRSMGKLSDKYNLTWILPVDSGFYYMLRLHFCNIIHQYTKPGKQDLWVALHPSPSTGEYHDAYLNGLEAFKLSTNRSLVSPNPELISTTPPPGPTPPVNRNKKKPPYAAIIGGIGGALVLLSILLLIFFQKRRRSKRSDATDNKSSYSTLPSDRCRRFSLTEVRAATNDFNDDFVIGIGGFGKVYKGHIDNAVAIKRLNESSNQGVQEFHAEIGFLSKLRHVQLVSLIGYCDEEGEMILVYEYMANGTLRDHLYKTNNPPLSWKRRLQICIGAAKGLHYLHTCSKRLIIHRDVKSTNILLDEKWVAKVSDFGLSKLGPRDQSQKHVSTMVKGSLGYLDPQYYRSQQLTEKSDVYSFGVVLLEVLCARPVINPKLPREEVNLAEWGKSCYQKGTLNKIMDPNVSSVIAPECLKKFGEVAVSCLKDERNERPAMEEVVWGLEFALELQEAADKTVGEAVSENKELLFPTQGYTTTDDDVLTGSSTIRNGMSSFSNTKEEFKSETVFSEIQMPAGR